MFAAVEARCVPRLQLKAETLFMADGEARVAALNLDFVYRGAPRDHAAERRARQVIESLGAVELASLDDAEVMPGARVDYVLRIDGDVHSLCAFSAYALPQLQQLGWEIEIDPEYPWQVVGHEAPLYADVAPSDRPDWFSLELGIEVDGHRVNLLPALLELIDHAADLDALTRSTRRCIAVPVDGKRWLPVPPQRLRMLCKVLVDMYRRGGRVMAPTARAAALAHLGAALHDESRPVRWTGDRKLRDQGYALALGPRPTAVVLDGLQAE